MSICMLLGSVLSEELGACVSAGTLEPLLHLWKGMLPEELVVVGPVVKEAVGEECDELRKHYPRII